MSDLPTTINHPELGAVEVPRPDMSEKEKARINRETQEKIDAAEGKNDGTV